eukprot:3179981-Prymnesium_polylepis.1
MAEMQYSMVHPKQTETALREKEAAEAHAARELKRSMGDVADARKLCLVVYDGCSTLLTQLVRAQKAVAGGGEEPAAGGGALSPGGSLSEETMNRLLEQTEGALTGIIVRRLALAPPPQPLVPLRIPEPRPPEPRPLGSDPPGAPHP